MVLGWDEQRPSEEDYKGFTEKLVGGLKNLDISGLSLMLYGSYVRGDYVAGRSDIDAVMTFPDDVVINKERLAKAGSVVHEALGNTHIPFQVTVTDVTTMKDGRFNSFTPSFKDYFASEGSAVVGPDYRGQFNYTLPERSEQVSLTFNLRKSRLGLLMAEHYLHTDRIKFLERFNKTMDAVSRGSKQIPALLDGEVRKNRFSGIEDIQEVFPDVDVGPLQTLKRLYHDLDGLDRLIRRPDNVLDLWQRSVTCFEEMIKGYVRRVPVDGPTTDSS